MMPERSHSLYQWRPAEYLFWCAPVATYFLFPENLVLITQMAIMGIFALSLDLILGYAGIISLGHVAFFGVGAYCAGLLAKHGWGEPISGLFIAAGCAAAVGFLSSFLVLRGSDLTRLMVTLGVAMTLYEAANQLSDITGGADGLQGIEMAPLFGRFGFDLYGKTAYVYSFVVLFALFALLRRLVASPFGLVLRGIMGNAERMPAIGTAVNRHLVVAYSVAAALAGAAGALLAQTTQFVALDALSFNRSAELLLILAFGGSGTLYGALLGTIAFMLAHQLLSELNPQYWEFWLGVILVAVVLFARGGIMGGLVRMRNTVARRRHD